MNPLIFLAFVLSTFHLSEFALSKHFHPNDTNASALLITGPYVAFHLFGVLEFIFEAALAPMFKVNIRTLLTGLGLVCILTGELLRKSAIITAGYNFTHTVRMSRDAKHKLVTSGPYRFMRHPSYVGFFIWAVGTQLYLGNILSAAAFAWKLKHFFSDRIEFEERLLRSFFGKQYEDYSAKTARCTIM